MRKRLLYMLLCAVVYNGTALGCFAQKESTWWVFGSGLVTAVEWSNGTPALAEVNDSVIYFMENNVQYGGYPTSYSDAQSGELLFYASSNGIFNRNHRSMPGSGLPHDDSGHGSAQSIVVPCPGHPSMYYFFYIRKDSNIYGYELLATLVDMALDGGLGDVVDTFRNVTITDTSLPIISATLHANGTDYWVMVRTSQTNRYEAFLVNENGINPTPVVSSIGCESVYLQGTMAFSHDGKLLASVLDSCLGIFDFNTATGQLTNPRLFIQGNNGIGFGRWGLEFSPDDTKLYAGQVQFDVSIPTEAAIAASWVPLYETNAQNPTVMSDLQLALDGKIYALCNRVAIWWSNNDYYAYHFDIIHNPNAAGLDCNVERCTFSFEGGRALHDLPQFPSNLFRPNFYADTLCAGQAANFEINFTFIDSVHWNFGDPASGAANTSTLVNATHVYSAAGTYTVTLIAQNGARTDTVVKTVTVKQHDPVVFDKRVGLCAGAGDSVRFAHGGRKGEYLWSTGSTDTSLVVHSPSDAPPTEKVWLQFTDACGTSADTALIFHSRLPVVSLGADTAVCVDSLSFIPATQNIDALTTTAWLNTAGDSVSFFPKYAAKRPTSKGGTDTLIFAAENTCGLAADTVAVTFLPLPDAQLPEDTLICRPMPLFLARPQTPGVAYLWTNASGVTTDTTVLRIDTTGLYTLISQSPCGEQADTIHVLFSVEPLEVAGTSTPFCPEEGGEVALTAPLSDKADALWQWSNGASSPTLTVSDTGYYTVTVTRGECTIVSRYRVRPDNCYPRCKPFIPNVLTPDGDNVNDRFGVWMECEAAHYRLEVFDRWGRQVWLSTDPAAKWDGTEDGHPSPDGTYFYMLIFTDENGTDKRFNGSVSVVR